MEKTVHLQYMNDGLAPCGSVTKMGHEGSVFKGARCFNSEVDFIERVEHGEIKPFVKTIVVIGYDRKKMHAWFVVLTDIC